MFYLELVAEVSDFGVKILFSRRFFDISFTVQSHATVKR